MATPSKKTWTQEEFLREVRPVKQAWRVYHMQTRGPSGHAVIVASAWDAEGRSYLLGDPVWTECADLAVASELATVPLEHAQSLMDSLWEMGVRPTKDPHEAQLTDHYLRISKLEGDVRVLETNVETLIEPEG